MVGLALRWTHPTCVVASRVSGELGSIKAQMRQQDEARHLLGLAVQTGGAAGFPGVERYEQMLAKLG